MSKKNKGTVVEQKQLFISSRKHLLSRGIPPSEQLRKIAEDGGIELHVLKRVVDKVNRELKQHSRKVYSRQMIEHVVEQIDMLYWESGTRHANEEGDASSDMLDDANAVCQDDDLTQDERMAKLPAHWDTATEPAASRHGSITQDDYLAAVSRLQDLSARRQMLQNKLNTYRTLLALLEPYRQPKDNIQPNLVWKDSPLAPELMKMRTLAIRVAGRVGDKFGNVQVPATAEDEDDDVDMDDVGEEGRRKVDRVLDSWWT
ncbi:hypothetical protein ACEQ8H_002506 [Pleosporales sp. CAS-2024a]